MKMRTWRNNYGISTTIGEEQTPNQDKDDNQEMEIEVDDVLLEQPELQLDQREEQLAIDQICSRKKWLLVVI